VETFIQQSLENGHLHQFYGKPVSSSSIYVRRKTHPPIDDTAKKDIQGHLL